MSLRLVLAASGCSPQSVPHAERCHYVLENSDTCLAADGLLHLRWLFYCVLDQNAIYLGFISALWILTLLVLMSKTASDFFCPALETISEALKLPPAVAGATLLAFGNGAPDVFVQLAAVTTGGPVTDHEQVVIALTEPVGGGLFVTNVVLGAVILVATRTQRMLVDPRTYLKDTLLYLLALLIVVWVLLTKQAYQVHGVLLLLTYVGYVAVTLLMKERADAVDTHDKHHVHTVHYLPPIVPMYKPDSPHSSNASASEHPHRWLPSPHRKHHERHAQGHSAETLAPLLQQFGSEDNPDAQPGAAHAARTQLLAAQLAAGTAPDAAAAAAAWHPEGERVACAHLLSHLALDAAGASTDGAPADGTAGSKDSDSSMPLANGQAHAAAGGSSVLEVPAGAGGLAARSQPGTAAPPLDVALLVSDTHRLLPGNTGDRPAQAGAGLDAALHAGAEAARGTMPAAPAPGRAAAAVEEPGLAGGQEASVPQGSATGAEPAPWHLAVRVHGAGPAAAGSPAAASSSSPVVQRVLHRIGDAEREVAEVAMECAGRAWEYLCLPLDLMLCCTMPYVATGGDPPYQRWQAMLLPFLTPLLLAYTLHLDLLSSPHPWWKLPAYLCLASLSSLATFKLWPVQTGPTGRLNMLMAAASFLLACLWMQWIAAELIAVCCFLGDLLGVPPSVMGSTLLSWGNGLPDLVCNTTMAREGFPTMALAAVFASPIFILAVGVGTALAAGVWSDPANMHAVHCPTRLLYLACLLTTLTHLLLGGAVFKFQLARPMALVGFALYLLFQGLNVAANLPNNPLRDWC